jgi:hypothetical protein
MSKNLIIGITVLALIIFAVIYFGFGDSGKITLLNIEDNTTIFVDGALEKTISRGKEAVNLNVSSGEHTVLVSREGYWPWLKEVEVVMEEILTLSPFAISQSTPGFFIPENDSEYQSIMTLFGEDELPSSENKKISSDENIGIWINGGSLFVEWLGEEEEKPMYFCDEFGCHDMFNAFTSSANIRNLDFYKNRNDIFILSFGTGIFAIEADKTGTQNFQPIFDGYSPEFVKNDSKTIYLLDNNSLSILEI